MTVLQATIRHERRIRLVFDAPQLSGMFVASRFTVTSFDGLSAPLTPVKQALVVAGQPEAVELALGQDLQQGGVYDIALDGVSVAQARFGQSMALATLQAPETDRAALLYGTDLMHDGNDFIETASGDLASVAGVANVRAALWRRMTSMGLPWDPTYAPKLREYIDGTPGALPGVRGLLTREAMADDRVASVDVTVSQTDDDPATVYYDLSFTLRGAADAVTMQLKF